MKRNILLLTALVLAAVVLSGCVLNPFSWGKVQVKWEGDAKKVFEKKDMDKYIKKDTGVPSVEVKYQKDINDEYVEIEITGKAELVGKLVKDDKVIGKEFAFEATKEDIVIKVTYTEPAE